MGGEHSDRTTTNMLNAHEAFNNGLTMLDGALCTFVGSGLATIASKDEDGKPQSVTLDAAVIGKAVEAEREALGDGAVGAWCYRLMGGGVIAFSEIGEPDSSVAVTAADLESAIAVLAN